MAFDVSYIFTARDKYTAIAKKVAATNDKVKRSATEASTALRAKMVPALAAVKAKAQGAKNQIASLTDSVRTKFIPAMRSVRNVGIGMTAAITLPIALGVKSLKDAARDAVETRTKFATVFKEMSSESETMADNLAKNFGLTGTKARELIGDTGDILTGFGLTTKKALDMSNQINELAVDLASFTNYSGGAEGASSALTKALLGERESLKSLGIAISEDLVKKKIGIMLSQGRKFASLAEAKAVATLALAVEQSKNAIGDFSRTQKELANQERITASRIQDLKEKFGKLLIPMSLKATQAIRKLAVWMTNLSPTAQKAILVVAGLVAVLGPLLLVAGAVALVLPVLAAGFALLFSPITLIIIAITAAVAAFLWLKANWVDVSDVIGGTIEQIGINFSLLWKKVRAGFESFVSFFMPAINALLFPIEKLMQFKSFLGSKAGEIFGTIQADQSVVASPAVATANARATVNGQITVSASEGSKVDSVESQRAFNGAQGNVGLGAAA